MKTEIVYSQYLTMDNKQIIEKVSSILSNNISMDFVINDGIIPTDEKTCTIKLIDSIGINELSETVTKSDIRALIMVLKQIFEQL